MRPGPFNPFDVGCRLAALLVAVASVLAMRAGHVSAGGVAVALSLGSLLRVPRRRVLYDLAAIALAIGFVAGEPVIYAALAALVTTIGLLAPEHATLRMNGMDRYFVAQENEDFACNVHFTIDARNAFDGAALTAAIEALVRDVAACRSFVREGALHAERFVTRRAWFAINEVLCFEDRVLDPALEADLIDAPFDLARLPPLRVLHGPRVGGGFRLVLTTHHSIGDGTAGLLLFDRLLQRYEEHKENRATAPFSTDPPARRFRDVVAHKGRGWAWRMVRRHLKPTGGIGVKNASLLDTEGIDAGPMRWILTSLDSSAWERLRAQTREAGPTRNDLLVSAALRASDRWRRARGREDKPFRLLLPTDLRPMLGLPACVQNFVGIVNAEFSAAETRAVELEALVTSRIRLGRDMEEAVETPFNLGVLGTLLPPRTFRKGLLDFQRRTDTFFFSLLFSHFRASTPLRRPVDVSVERVFGRVAICRPPAFGLVVLADGENVNVAIGWRAKLATEESVASYRAMFDEEVAKIANA